MGDKKAKDAQKAKVYEIHCPSCGAPARYDIKRKIYVCRFCRGTVGINQALAAHKGFRKIQHQKMNESLKNFTLQRAKCTGCGAEVVFEKNEAIANCAFCRKSLVRKNFVNADTIPELVIPFSITEKEAKDLLSSWCKKNARKEEAKAISEKIEELKGFYLPYELVRGPVTGSVFREENGGIYDCGGFVDEVFVNCSKNLDNLLLDAMEPFDLEELKEFDFAYVAGHQVKTPDITGDELEQRIDAEVAENYRPIVQKTLEAKAVNVSIDSDKVLRMPVLLPVYYLTFDGFMAVVNGQTGKVSVRGLKEAHYILLPWWLKAIGSSILSVGAIVLGMYLFGAEPDLIKTAAGCLGLILTIVFFAAYSYERSEGKIVSGERKIFTTKGGPYVRERGLLVQSKKELKKPVTTPLFFMNINGRWETVEIKFTSFLRVARMFLIAFVVMFLPVIIALFLNGFHFSQLNLAGSAVWFCLAVPLTPILLIKYGRIELYYNPWIYIVGENGKKTRYKPKKEKLFSSDEIKEIIVACLKPPALFLTLFVVFVFISMCYLTAFGFIE